LGGRRTDEVNEATQQPAVMRSRRAGRWIGLATVGAGTAGAIVALSASPAAAAPAALGCSANAQVRVTADTPYQSGANVLDHGTIISSPSFMCTQNGGEVHAETKACGSFGCNWQTRGEFDGQVQVNAWDHTASQACRSGTNRYRTRTVFNYMQIDVVQGIPVFVPEELSYTSPNQPEFSCK
jgi:hypothetical protein